MRLAGAHSRAWLRASNSDFLEQQRPCESAHTGGSIEPASTDSYVDARPDVSGDSRPVALVELQSLQKAMVLILAPNGLAEVRRGDRPPPLTITVRIGAARSLARRGVDLVLGGDILPFSASRLCHFCEESEPTLIVLARSIDTSG
eukprot:COSAG05_NODE_43_length_25931_cov_49.314636_14_plen_146_part_00